MKKPDSRTIFIYLSILVVGIVIGSQIPSVRTHIKNRESERQALKQIEKAPNDPNNWLLVSMSRWRKGDQKGSFDAIKKALELDPNYVIAMETMAFNYMDLGQYQDAEKWLKRALETAKSHAPGEIEKLKFALSTVQKEIDP